MKDKVRTYRLNIQEVYGDVFETGAQIDVEATVCLRDLPKRRSVWKADYQGRDILLKIFDPHPKQQRDIGREWNISSTLSEAGLPIPAPLFRAQLDGGYLAVAFTYIPNGTNLKQVLRTADSEALTDCYTQLLALHAQQHACGCYQSDNHLGNYFWSAGKLCMLDAGSCIVQSAPLEMKARVANMAELTANIPLPQRQIYDALFSAYLDLYPGDYDREEFTSLSVLEVPRAIRKRLGKYLRKTRRSSGSFEHEKHTGQSWHACRDIDPELKQKIRRDPDLLFAENKQQVEQTKSHTSVVINIGEKSYLLKKYHSPTIWEKLSRRKAGARSFQALTHWSHGQALRLFGVHTPRPVACLTFKKGLFKEESILVLEYVESESLTDETISSMPSASELFSQIWDDLKTLEINLGNLRLADFSLDSNGAVMLSHTEHVHFKAAKERAGSVRICLDIEKLLA